MAEKILLAERARLTGSVADAEAAKAAFDRIAQLTARYNAIGNGKWAGIMHAQPRNLPVFSMPPTKTEPDPVREAGLPAESLPGATALKIDLAKFAQRRDQAGAGWRVIEGLGPRGRALALLPHRDTPTRVSPEEIRDESAMLEYRVNAAKAGDVEIVIDALPTHRLTPEHQTVAAVSVNDEPPVLVRFDEGVDEENNPIWQRNVLRNAMYGRATLRVPQGAYTLKLWAADPGVVVQQIAINSR